MAVYKVIQDIESEDKLLGPLTFKSFIYAAIAGTCAFIEFRLFLIGSPLKWLFILLFALPMLLFGVLASPLGREQPTEVWLLSRVRFLLKPRQRIWKMEGGTDLVKITAPKKLEAHLTKDLSQTEVQSRLKTLAQTLDTRGWAIKNMNVNLSSPDTQSKIVEPSSDRLISGSGVSQQTPAADVQPADDILDEKNNPTAQKFEVMMQKKEAERKHGLLAKLKGLVIEEDNRKKSNIHSKTTTPKLDDRITTRKLAGDEGLQKKEVDKK
ncbi:MAG TPA: PrgI family protein, partial [Candidatus Babeliales bacterium]|nr:PrgI family protein [Candidatus Babeliales bacterium]